VHPYYGAGRKDTQGPNYAIVIKATKELLGKLLLDPKGAPSRNLTWKR
jgi:hypothetical protein